MYSKSKKMVEENQEFNSAWKHQFAFNANGLLKKLKLS